MKTRLLLLAATPATACAFGYRRHHPMPQATPHFQRTNLAAIATDQSEHESTSSTSMSPGPPFRLQRIDHVVIRCQNFPAMFDFYHRVLGCTIDEPMGDHMNRFGGALTHLRAGSCYIDLLAYDTNHLSEEGLEAAARMHGGGVGLGDKIIADVNLSSETSTLDHLCLRVNPFDQTQLLDYLKEENADIVTAGEKRLGADGVGPSVYVRDPEGNVIELKGSPYQPSIGGAENNQDYESNRGQKGTIPLRSRVNDDGGGESQLKDAPKESLPSKATAQGSNILSIPMTPCNRICRYNSSFYDGNVCIGCFREAYEIEMWQGMTNVQKSMTLLDAIDRCSDSSQGSEMGEGFDGAIPMVELTRQYEHWSELAKIK